jgi:hypothetical protein
MLSMDVIHVHDEKGREHGKIRGNTTTKIDDYLWVVHESWCYVKPLLHQINDRIINTRETSSGCCGWSEKRADGLKKDEGICQSKLRRMGMMGKWMEAIA